MYGNVKGTTIPASVRIGFNDVYLYDVTFGIKKRINIHIKFRFFKSCEYSNKGRITGMLV
jgi:hypothetical protein